MGRKRTHRPFARLARLAVAILGPGLGFCAYAGAIACSTTPSQPTGDRVVNDTKPTPSATSTGDQDSAPPPPPADGGIYDAHPYAVPDGYSPTSVCDKCACASKDAGFCFGGGTGKSEAPTECVVPRDNAGDGGVPASELLVGCNPIPPECATSLDCSCLIAHVKLPCYTVCSDKGGFRIYCPNP
jgi:hypothetical protein